MQLGSIEDIIKYLDFQIDNRSADSEEASCIMEARDTLVTSIEKTTAHNDTIYNLPMKRGFYSPKFTIKEIEKATGARSHVVCGISYAAEELVIPLNEKYGLLFREGEDYVDDHEVSIIELSKANKEHACSTGK